MISAIQDVPIAPTAKAIAGDSDYDWRVEVSGRASGTGGLSPASCMR